MILTSLFIVSALVNAYLLRKLKRSGRRILELEYAERFWRREMERWQDIYMAVFQDNGHQHVYDSDVKIDCMSGRLFIYCACGKQMKATGRMHAA